MRIIRNLIVLAILSMPICALAQTGKTTINKTDSNGLRQGTWRMHYPGGALLYEGYFRDGVPVGEFRRYYENGTIRAFLNYKAESDSVTTLFYHPNGFKAAKGIYVAQKKEGLWKLFSEETEDYMVCEEYYNNDLRDSISIKYYKNGKIAEIIHYRANVRHGEWKQFYTGGDICIDANYVDGNLNGNFSVFYLNGNLQYLGQYSQNVRDGTWRVFTEEGKPEHEMIYEMGALQNREILAKENDFLDFLERNRGRISDPEITGVIWEF